MDTADAVRWLHRRARLGRMPGRAATLSGVDPRTVLGGMLAARPIPIHGQRSTSLTATAMAVRRFEDGSAG